MSVEEEMLMEVCDRTVEIILEYGSVCEHIMGVCMGN
jgi:hypothetical protein